MIVLCNRAEADAGELCEPDRAALLGDKLGAAEADPEDEEPEPQPVKSEWCRRLFKPGVSLTLLLQRMPSRS